MVQACVMCKKVDQLNPDLSFYRSKKLNAPAQFKNSSLAVFKLFVLQIVKDAEIPPGSVGSLFMGMLFLFGLFLTASYSSGLATVLTIPTYENVVDTVDEMIESGMQWLGEHMVWVNSLVNSDHPRYKALVKLFVAVPSNEEMAKYLRTSKYTFVLERFPNYNYAIEPYITRDVIENYVVMKDDVYFDLFVIMGRKSSILLPQLNQFLYRTFEAGLISYWQSEATLLYMDSHIQNALNPHIQKNREYTVKLKWTHVAGTFTILGLGYIISTIIFLLELLINRLSKRSSAQFNPNNHRLVLE